VIIDNVTLLPVMFAAGFGRSVIARGVGKGALTINLYQLRDYDADRHRTVDAAPFGGGPGMVLKAEPLFKAVDDLRRDGARVVLTSPQGAPFTQKTAERLARLSHLILVCGRYEGVDERFAEHGADEQISVGPYVLTGGELAAMIIVDATARLLPDALGNPASAAEDSFASAKAGRLKAPVYTRPAELRGWKVPEVLLSGDHRRIAEWRAKIENQRSPRRDL